MKVNNTSERDIHLSADGVSVVIPMGREGKDDEGRTVIIPGSADVPDDLLEALADNPVVKYYYQEGKLVNDEGATEKGGQKQVDPALQQAVDDAKTLVQVAMDKVANAPDAKTKTAAEKELVAAQQTLTNAEAALGA
jgi:hypothetical protein